MVGCRQSLREACAQYENDHIVVMCSEYFLVESWLAELEREKTPMEQLAVQNTSTVPCDLVRRVW